MYLLVCAVTGQREGSRTYLLSVLLLAAKGPDVSFCLCCYYAKGSDVSSNCAVTAAKGPDVSFCLCCYWPRRVQMYLLVCAVTGSKGLDVSFICAKALAAKGPDDLSFLRPVVTGREGFRCIFLSVLLPVAKRSRDVSSVCAVITRRVQILFCLCCYWPRRVL
ncbi:hypothetical protein AVEN_173486-1 [Araneus ventricosus]|uniref:Uncharacterized protein n=1 Tax=Araneus ventricosus TaxID=182803 RepID=A0A4Y2KIL9_ARAVE|nr:hypothetical protein AVEN_173486-1 [Araneus ventricosus]